MAADGLITMPSSYGPKETMERLKAEAAAKGLTILARIDHTAGATQVGLQLRPTELLIFGNAKAGTPLMQSNQEVGIDLPLKALVWEDPEGKTWLAYNGPELDRKTPRARAGDESDRRSHASRTSRYCEKSDRAPVAAPPMLLI